VLFCSAPTHVAPPPLPPRSTLRSYVMNSHLAVNPWSIFEFSTQMDLVRHYLPVHVRCSPSFLAPPCLLIPPPHSLTFPPKPSILTLAPSLPLPPSPLPDCASPLPILTPHFLTPPPLFQSVTCVRQALMMDDNERLSREFRDYQIILDNPCSKWSHSVRGRYPGCYALLSLSSFD
jgi:hypothetical protein